MQVVTTTETGVLVKSEMVDGVYIRHIEVPIEIKLVGQTTDLQPKRFIAKVPVARIPTLDSVVGGRAWPNRPPAAKTVLPTSSKSCWLPRPMPEVNALDRHC